MNSKILHFDEIKEKVINLLLQFKSRNTDNMLSIYVIRDVFGRVSVYVVNQDGVYIPDAIEKALLELRELFETEIGSSWFNKVEEISSNQSIINQLRESTFEVTNSIYFGERHLTRLNWFREKNKYINLPKTKVVTFYSFKGGLGRTTSLVMSALNLARKGKTVVLVDFDLEAPGLASLLPPDNDETPNYGLIDFLIESNVYTQLEVDINEYTYSFKDKQLLGNNGGQVYILPASKLTTEKADDYLEKMGRVDFNSPIYERIDNPVSRMLKQISDRFKPEFILLDARTGINDVGGLTLTNYTDLACLLFYGNEQNIAGMRLVLPKVIQAEVPFLLINSPVPITEEESKEELEYYLENTYNLLVESDYFPEYLPDIYDESADHYPINISYDSLAVLLNSNSRLKKLLDNSGSSNGYIELSEQIASFFGEDLGQRIIENYTNKSTILTEISEIMTGALAASENEFNTSEDLVNKFYPLREHRFIFDTEKFLILGP
ncbi:KGGVGR-motif variant AAA ATPase [Paenibacillus sp. TAB 01]|uniref:KGGVGR-motif variant AAA ATPase n=1 Tax=Paenibacillus sp. TAB 01 TaxID=3368988 RepID=UPI00375176BC